MNFDQVVAAHSAWKARLYDYIHKPDNSIKVADAETPDKCELGKWLNTEASVQWKHLPEFAAVVEAHRKFHRAAADVVRAVDGGKLFGEDELIGGQSPFLTTSTQLVLCLAQLKKKVS